MGTDLNFVSPAAAGLDEQRWQQVIALAQSWCETDQVPSIGLIAGRSDRATSVHLFGRQNLALDSPPIRDDAILLIASITKPIVAMGVLLLVERGLCTLSDRVGDFVPEFTGQGRYGTRIRHLLTHTSGLPDMLPNNRELRAAHAPLIEFVRGTCATQPDFAPGRNVRYQSMGYAVLGELVHRITGLTCAEFLKREIFDPLGMADTALGAPASWFDGPRAMIDRVLEIRVPPDQRDAHDWNWNSRYWRSLGSPWGGLLTSPADLAKFAQMMLRHGRGPSGQVLSPASVEAATCNQLVGMVEIPPEERTARPWGYGWRLYWPGNSVNFGDLLSPRAYGHWGASGTVMWIDPERDAFAVVLTTQPQEPHGHFVTRMSNAIAACFLP